MAKVCILTLGCKVNQYESDDIGRQISGEGFDVVNHRLEKADVYIVNTCAITGYAEKKSRYQISRIVRLDPNARIIVCGCASQINSVQFDSPNTVKIFGTDKTDIKVALTEMLGGIDALDSRGYHDGAKSYKTGQARNRVFIKAQDGCDNFCSYCIVPYLRGRSRSRRIEDITAEINGLPGFVREVVLTGIDLSSFEGLGGLCEAVDLCGRAFRLSSIEARIITHEFLEVLRNCKNFCPSFHIPLQSGSDSVLKAMNRKYNAAEFFEKVRLVRTFFPEAQITTDIICGFPAETESNFYETVGFVKAVGFLDAHIFPYSRRTGTAAAKLPPLAESIITRRTKELIQVQNEISKEIKAGYIGKTIDILFEYEKDGFTYGTSREYLQVKAKGSFPLEFRKVTVDNDIYQVVI